MIKRYEKAIETYNKLLVEDNDAIRKVKLANYTTDMKILSETGSCAGLVLKCPDCPMFGKNCAIKQGTEIREYLNEEIE